MNYESRMAGLPTDEMLVERLLQDLQQFIYKRRGF